MWHDDVREYYWMAFDMVHNSHGPTFAARSCRKFNVKRWMWNNPNIFSERVVDYIEIVVDVVHTGCMSMSLLLISSLSVFISLFPTTRNHNMNNLNRIFPNAQRLESETCAHFAHCARCSFPYANKFQVKTSGTRHCECARSPSSHT